MMEKARRIESNEESGRFGRVLTPVWMQWLSVVSATCACTAAIYGIWLQNYTLAIGPGMAWMLISLIFGLIACFFFRKFNGIMTSFDRCEISATQTLWELRPLGVEPPKRPEIEGLSA